MTDRKKIKKLFDIDINDLLDNTEEKEVDEEGKTFRRVGVPAGGQRPRTPRTVSPRTVSPAEQRRKARIEARIEARQREKARERARQEARERDRQRQEAIRRGEPAVRTPEERRRIDQIKQREAREREREKERERIRLENEKERELNVIEKFVIDVLKRSDALLKKLLLDILSNITGIRDPSGDVEERGRSVFGEGIEAIIEVNGALGGLGDSFENFANVTRNTTSVLGNEIKSSVSSVGESLSRFVNSFERLGENLARNLR